MLSLLHTLYIMASQIRRRSESGAGFGRLTEVQREFANAIGADGIAATEEELYAAAAADAFQSLDQERKKKVLEVYEDREWFTTIKVGVEFLVFLSSVAWMIAFIVFVAKDTYPNDLDYTTDFLNRSTDPDTYCPNYDSHHVCQNAEVFGPHKTMTVSVLFMLMFIGMSSSYVVCIVTGLFLDFRGWLINPEGAVLIAQLEAMIPSGIARSTLNALFRPMSYFSYQAYNSVTLLYSARHVVFDTILYPILFAATGVRDWGSLCQIGTLALIWNCATLIAQHANRFSWIIQTIVEIGPLNVEELRNYVRGSKGSNVSNPSLMRPAALWFMPVVQFLLGATLGCNIMIHWLKVPYHSRTSQMDLAFSIVAINIIIRSVFNLCRWVVRDVRLGKYGYDTEVKGVLPRVMRLSSRAVWLVYSMLFQFPFLIDFVLEVYDFLLCVVPLILLFSVEGKVNIARMSLEGVALYW